MIRAKGQKIGKSADVVYGRPHSILAFPQLRNSLKEDESLENNPNVYDYEDSIEKLKKQKMKARIDQNLLPGVNFINVLCSAFTLVEPKSVKKYS